MRKIFLLMLTLCCLAISAVACAAQVTDVKWGVDKDNVLRFVIDMTEQANYKINLDGKQLTVTVDAELQNKNSRTSKMRSTLAPVMHIVPSGKQTLIKVPLTRAIQASDYKAFTLRKDPQTKRPPRIVLDITADKKLNSVILPDKTNTDKEKDVVGNKPTTTEEKSKKDKKKDKKEDKKKNKDKDEELKVVKGDGNYATKGGLKGKIITLDPGHGGHDPGAIGPNGTYEKTVTLGIALKVRDMLVERGAKVYMTRSKDVDLCGAAASDVEELQARVNIAEKHNSDLFISLHTNSSLNKKVGGFSTYYYPKTKNDARIAKAIQKQLTEHFGVDDMGVREANFYVIKRCSMPASLLELCFISNKKEEKLMKGKWFRNKTAKLIADGIEDYFG